ncbi:MAG: hypothetical protein LBI87_12095 [Candidatus Accumulibacter sp.]|nr:hypothetical protein [Accumulibacter sp.]
MEKPETPVAILAPRPSPAWRGGLILFQQLVRITHDSGRGERGGKRETKGGTEFPSRQQNPVLEAAAGNSPMPDSGPRPPPFIPAVRSIYEMERFFTASGAGGCR